MVPCRLRKLKGNLWYVSQRQSTVTPNNDTAAGEKKAGVGRVELLIS